MGAAWFGRFRDWTEAADAVLGYSIRELCVEDPASQLGQTAFTQPALFVVNAMTYRARVEAGRAKPDFLAGHSLGEYNALLAAGAVDFETGLRLVRERGRLMGEVAGGGMSAVVGLAPDRIERVLASSEAGRRIDVANFNSCEQTVIAGPREDLAAVKLDLVAAGGRVVPLKVSAPFHSRYMREAQDVFERVLAEVLFQPPRIPVVSNVAARPYDPDAIRETLGRQIGTSVRWLESMQYLLSQPSPAFEEVGPGTVLTKLTQQIRHATI